MVRLVTMLAFAAALGNGARISKLDDIDPVEVLKSIKSMENPRERRSAMRKVAKSDPSISDTLDAIVEVLQEDEDGDVRRAAAGALGRMGEGIGTKGTDALLECLAKDEYAPTRRDCAFAFGRLKEFTGSVDALSTAVGDSDAEVRRESIVSLGKIAFGSGNSAVASSVPKIVGALQSDADVSVRREAAVALGVMKCPITCENLPALSKAAKEDTVLSVRREACRAMIYVLGDSAAEAKAAEVLHEVAETDSEEEVREAAANILKRMKID
jgi:HEAT repeat protein